MSEKNETPRAKVDALKEMFKNSELYQPRLDSMGGRLRGATKEKVDLESELGGAAKCELRLEGMVSALESEGAELRKDCRG